MKKQTTKLARKTHEQMWVKSQHFPSQPWMHSIASIVSVEWQKFVRKSKKEYYRNLNQKLPIRSVRCMYVWIVRCLSWFVTCWEKYFCLSLYERMLIICLTKVFGRCVGSTQAYCVFDLSFPSVILLIFLLNKEIGWIS